MLAAQNGTYSSPSFYNPDLLLLQIVKLVDLGVDLPVFGSVPVPDAGPLMRRAGLADNYLDRWEI